MIAEQYVRSGNGSILLEMQTYRYRGHSMSDPGKYRSKEEVDAMKNQSDPIESLKQLLIKNYKMDETHFEIIEDEIKNIVLEAVEFAKASPEPHPDELYTDVLKDEVVKPFGAPLVDDHDNRSLPSQPHSTINW